jgi:hypothetical protein
VDCWRVLLSGMLLPSLKIEVIRGVVALFVVIVKARALALGRTGRANSS